MPATTDARAPATAAHADAIARDAARRERAAKCPRRARGSRAARETPWARRDGRADATATGENLWRRARARDDGRRRRATGTRSALTRGSEGVEVAKLQQRLADEGIEDGGAVDGCVTAMSRLFEFAARARDAGREGANGEGGRAIERTRMERRAFVDDGGRSMGRRDAG